MSKYKCGHEPETIILDDNLVSVTAFYEWLESDGWKGTSESCWNCFCKKFPSHGKIAPCMRCGKNPQRGTINGLYDNGAFSFNVCFDCYIKIKEFIFLKPSQLTEKIQEKKQ